MKFLLPFYDDSTLIFASTMREKLVSSGHMAVAAEIGGHKIAQRQILTYLPQGVDKKISMDSIPLLRRTDFDALITCKAPAILRYALESNKFRRSGNRPAFVAFQPGLEFTPERGRDNRRNFDIVFLNSKGHRDSFRENVKRREWQHISFGHPYFMNPPKEERGFGKNIYFFAQAISPSTLEARKFIVDILCVLARRYSNENFFLKLRHLPEENLDHVHKEEFSYPWIMENFFPSRPENIKITVCSVAEALRDAKLAVTCTSTAVMDAVSAGVPAIVYLDYVENYLDRHVEPMRREFEGSGLLASLPQLMALNAHNPDSDWVAQHFRGADLFDEILASVEAFHNTKL